MTTTHTALLEQAYAMLSSSATGIKQTMCRDDLVVAIRAELAKPVEVADPLDWPLPCDIKIGGGTHGKGTSLRSLVLRMKALHEAAFPGQASITPAQQDANLERLRNPPALTPAWHDAPTEPGLWLCLDSRKRIVSYEITDETKVIVVRPGDRWYGPIPQDAKAEGSAA